MSSRVKESSVKPHRIKIGPPFSHKMKHTKKHSSMQPIVTHDRKIIRTPIPKPFSQKRSHFMKREPYTTMPTSAVDLYRGPTNLTIELRNELLQNQSQILENALIHERIADTTTTRGLQTTSDVDISSITPSTLNYNIQIFQGSEYPYPEYVDFLYEKACNLLDFGEISGRTCVSVNRFVVDSVTEPNYQSMTAAVQKQKIGEAVIGTSVQIPVEKKIEVSSFKRETIGNLSNFSVKDYNKSMQETVIDPDYVTDLLTEDPLFKTNLTVALTTRDKRRPEKAIIASMVILNNGEDVDNLKSVRNNVQHIEMIANNPRIDLYPYTKSSAMAILFPLIRETTILASYLPNADTFLRHPSAFFTPSIPPSVEQKSPVYQFIYKYLTYCATHKAKPTMNDIATVSNYQKLTLTAISWEVALIYRKMGFVPVKIEENHIHMELPVSRMPETLSVNRIGFIFSLLQEMSLDTLTTGDLAAITAELQRTIHLATPRQLVGRRKIAPPDRETAPSIVSIARGHHKPQRSRSRRRRCIRSCKKTRRR